MIDICIVTKLTQNYYFKLIESIKQFTNCEINFYVCYTGDDPTEFQRLDQSLAGFKHSTIQRTYNFAKNSNELASLGDSDKILFLNDDIEFTDDAITAMENALNADNVGAVGLKLLYPDGTVQHFGQHLFLTSSLTFVGITHYGLKRPDEKTGNMFAQGVTGGCLMIRRNIFEKIGGFDENYKRCFEDVQLSWQVRLAGYDIICVGTNSAIHYESQTRGKGDLDQNDISRMQSFWNSHKKQLVDLKYCNTISIIYDKNFV